MAKIISIPLAIIMLLFSWIIPGEKPEVNKDEWQTNYKYVWVHGLMGWGSYDFYYDIFPYWGVLNGDLMKKLNKVGYDCYAASVAGTASAWDRACELYAQLTGTVVDYGAAHSARCGHDRYGKDFTGKALIDEWDSTNKINILGHSFGGATVRLFASLMAVGSEEEMNASPNDVSPFFTGGKADWIYSVTSLAAPHNGTSAYDSMTTDIDSAAYDMYIDNALELNKTIVTSEDTYYFSIACSATDKQADGTYAVDGAIMEKMFQSSANEIGRYTGLTEGGFEIDETWLENDGLVNTVSALAPSSAPSKEYDASSVEKGVWNIMPVYRGDHMSLQGGFSKVNSDIFSYYVNYLDMINGL
ncbi:MAG: hypothetical protein IKK09_13065 [Clostridia bacterium]|nr:hypothetical protein [Clostridia bacterium]